MITNRVYKLKKAEEVRPGMPLPAGQELEIVMDVVYMNGYMIPPELQSIMYDWIINNESSLDDVTKNW